MTAKPGEKNNLGTKMCKRYPLKPKCVNNKKIKGVLANFCTFPLIIKDIKVNYPKAGSCIKDIR